MLPKPKSQSQPKRASKNKPEPRSYFWHSYRDTMDLMAAKAQFNIGPYASIDKAMKVHNENIREILGEGSEDYNFHNPRARWRLPIRYGFHDRRFKFPNPNSPDISLYQAQQAVHAAFEHFNKVFQSHVFVYEQATKQITVLARPIDGEKGQAAITYLTWKGHGEKASMQSARINLDIDDQWMISKEQVCGVKGKKYDIQNCVTHCICHVLGLDHCKDKLSCVYSQIRPGETIRRTFSKGDIIAIRSQIQQQI